MTSELRSALSAPSSSGGLRSVKVAAAAWRQRVFHLSAAGPDPTASFLARPRLDRLPEVVASPVDLLLGGLAAAHRGDRLAGTRAPRTHDELSTHPSSAGPPTPGILCSPSPKAHGPKYSNLYRRWSR